MGRRGILNEVYNFIDLYLHHVGQSEVPRIYHEWSAISLLAACARDRIWFEKFSGKKLMPNLFVYLIGPSGSGKDNAAETAMEFIEEFHEIRCYHGKASAQYFYDWICRKPKDANGNMLAEQDPRVWFVTPELANSIGTGPSADAFLKFMTDLYHGKVRAWQEGTRTSGAHTLKKSPCINWLAGSTREWLCQAVSHQEILGGFFARVCAVEPVIDYDKRLFRPTVPEDHLRVRDHLLERLYAIVQAEGVFSSTPDADAIERRWYEHRPVPADQILLPSWKRQHDQVLKLSMLYALADWREGEEFVWHKQHMVKAQRVSNNLLRSVSQLAAFSGARSIDAAALVMVAEIIRQAGRIQRSTLLRRVYPLGIGSEVLARIIHTLQQARELVVFEPKGVGGREASPIYVWQTKSFAKRIKEFSTHDHAEGSLRSEED